MTLPLEGKRILVTGGVGSLGKVLIKRLLGAEMGLPEKIVVFSRDEAKQHFMRSEYRNAAAATDEIIYRDSQHILEFRIGDIRDFHSVITTLRKIDVVINAAALKQVPTCEYTPFEAVRTNIEGPENIVRAIQEHQLPVETVVGISTDKACKPTNVMGMTKAIMERLFIHANLRCPGTRFVCVRYGNVLASRGSVIPLFHDQIRKGGPVTVTSSDMTRFLMSLNQAVDVVFEAIRVGKPGETFIPQTYAANMENLAIALIDGRDIEIRHIGVRPGEKIDEILVSEEEIYRTRKQGKYFVIGSMLPELHDPKGYEPCLKEPYSSASFVMDLEQTRAMLVENNLQFEEDRPTEGGELLR